MKYCVFKGSDEKNGQNLEIVHSKKRNERRFENGPKGLYIQTKYSGEYNTRICDFFDAFSESRV